MNRSMSFPMPYVMTNAYSPPASTAPICLPSGPTPPPDSSPAGPPVITEVANTPISTGPTIPATRGTPPTSSESAQPKRNFPLPASEQSPPAASPISSAPATPTEPHDGVIATSPATAPDAAPRVVAWPSRPGSTTSQPNTPAHPAPS